MAGMVVVVEEEEVKKPFFQHLTPIRRRVDRRVDLRLT